MSEKNVPENGNRGWLHALEHQLQPRVLIMLFLGFASGLPLLLVFGTLSTWLARLGISKTEIGFFSWVGITFSLKVFWAPVVDRIKLPMLTSILGKRRSWMLLAQIGIIAGLLGIAFTDPTQSLLVVALFSLLTAFSAATQDITIDAFRIESGTDDVQGAMAANYQLGYRVGMIAAGAGALYVAGTVSWPIAYMSMAALMMVGIGTVLIIREPEHSEPPALDMNLGQTERNQVSVNIAWIAGLFGLVALVGLSLAAKDLTQYAFSALLVIALTLGAVAFAARTGRAQAVVGWFHPSVVMPFLDFFQRLGWFSLVILLLMSVYKLSDVTLGIMANPFYIDLGFSEIDIANVAKLYGLGMTMVGTVIGGVLISRFGIGKALIFGALLMPFTNLFFAWLALMGPQIEYLIVTISADNFTQGVASTALIAYASSMTNRTFSATQYALFSSLFTLVGKFLGGFSGIVVDSYGYFNFFIVVAILGIPAIILSIVVIYFNPLNKQASSGGDATAQVRTKPAE